MKKLGSNARAAQTLTPSLESRLFAYAAAAGAAGVSLLALAPSSEAKVIYTPTHQVIAQHSGFKLDLNADGITDFVVSNLSSDFNPIRNTNGSPFTFAFLRVYPGLKSNQIWNKGGFEPPLAKGITISSKGSFNQSIVPMGEVSSNQQVVGRTYRGPWAPPMGSVTDKFIGLKFLINGQPHYGWARFSAKIRPAETTGAHAILTGYAYESVANKPIVTGKTTGPDVVTMPEVSLGRLALGAAGR